MSPLYRVFPFEPGAAPTGEGGALFVPRFLQGEGRHDNPDIYTALYVTRVPASAAAEYLRRFVGRALTEDRLRSEGRRVGVAQIDGASGAGLLDLDDPSELAGRGLRPSRVATLDRETTQPIARAVFEEGAAGFEWWSTIEASWINVTLFAERAVPKLSLVGAPEPLSLDHPAVREAAEALGIPLAR